MFFHRVANITPELLRFVVRLCSVKAIFWRSEIRITKYKLGRGQAATHEPLSNLNAERAR
jgi:hypothetical protein